MGPSVRPFGQFFSARVPAVLVLLLLPLVLASQNVPQAPQIHVSTHLVQIGVIVRDSHGSVEDLTKDDFVILDRGKPQQISVFSVESSESEPQPAQPLPQNTFSDLRQYEATKPRSVTIVLLDNLNTLIGSSPVPYETSPFWLEDHALANAKQHLMEFLKQLDANDRLAIYGLTDSVHVLCDFTCDRAQLLAVVNKYDATSKTQREVVEPGQFHLPNVAPEFDEAIDADVLRLAALNNQARAQATMAALTAIAAHVADIPGRKNLLWLTANLPFSGEVIARMLSRANIAAYPIDARGLLPRAATTSPEVEPVGGGQLRNALGLAAPADQTDQPIGVDAMQKIAEVTGGRAFVNTNDLTGAIRKAVEDSAVNYTLGFYIDADSLDGKFHELKVKVARSGLNLRYPKGYFALNDAPATQNERHNNFLAALRSPLDSSSIPVQVRVVRVEEPLPHCLSLFGLIDIHNLRLEQKGGLRKGAVEVATIEQDETGKILRQSASRINLNFKEAQYLAILKSGFTFHQFVQPQAGVTTLRIFVEDPTTAQLGSLIIPLAQVN
ncbi:MAG: VWA domain-containing protein [Candidatus Acidiferrum sp.]